MLGFFVHERVANFVGIGDDQERELPQSFCKGLCLFKFLRCGLVGKIGLGDRPEQKLSGILNQDHNVLGAICLKSAASELARVMFHHLQGIEGRLGEHSQRLEHK